MIEQSRRGFVVSSALAASYFGLNGPIEFIAPAAAAIADMKAKGFHTYQLGDIEVVTLFDGEWAKPHDPSFVRNASVEQTKAALRDAGLPDGHVPITFTITVLKSGGKTLMFDSGTGGQLAPTAGKLPASMVAAGIDPAKINTIVVTHFHPDHIFGLMAKDTNSPVYPNAEIVVPEAEIAWWLDDGNVAKLPDDRKGLAARIESTLGAWKNVRRIKDGIEVAPGIAAVAAHGHTPGHTVFRVTSGDKVLMNLADTTNIPALFARHPGWHAMFDADPAEAEASRRRLFEEAVSEGSVVAGYHYGMPGAGRMEKDGAGYAFVPLA